MNSIRNLKNRVAAKERKIVYTTIAVLGTAVWVQRRAIIQHNQFLEILELTDVFYGEEE